MAGQPNIVYHDVSGSEGSKVEYSDWETPDCCEDFSEFVWKEYQGEHYYLGNDLRIRLSQFWPENRCKKSL
jgi:hypothetical protein